MSQRDAKLMARALRLAERGRYSTHPNPRVGCVIARAGEVLGEGWHVAAGRAHAEVIALRAAGPGARGATAYISLEPCCHTGRTPPCTQALIEAGIARVVYAMEDPDPRVAGRGREALEAAGIAVEAGIGAAAAQQLNLGFCTRMRTGRPWVRLKTAISLDGKTALANGYSQWISSPAAREDVQDWRAQSSAILTGVGTVTSDDPRLTVRAAVYDDIGRTPVRVVVDSRLRVSPTAKLFQDSASALVFHANADPQHVERLRGLGVRVEQVAARDGRVDLLLVLQRLAQLEINEVLVEAGATLSGALLRAGLIDELIIYLAPHIMGDGARGMMSLPQLSSMDQRYPFEFTGLRRIGEDLRITARPRAASD